MKKTLTSLSLLTVLLVATPVYAVTYVGNSVKNSVEENATDETKEAIADVRTQGMLTAIEQARKVLDNLQTRVDDAEYVSEETATQAQDLIDGANTELDELEDQVNEASDNEELDQAKADLVAWLKENKDAFKEVMVSLYVDGLNGSLAAAKETVEGAEALVPYYQRYDLDTDDLENAIASANDSIDEAEPLIEAADEDRTQEALQEASQAAVKMADDTIQVVDEADALLTEMSDAESDSSDDEDEDSDEDENDNTNDEDEDEE